MGTFRDVGAHSVIWEAEEETENRVGDGHRRAAGGERAGIGERENTVPLVRSEHHVREEALPDPVVTDRLVSADLVA